MSDVWETKLVEKLKSQNPGINPEVVHEKAEQLWAGIKPFFYTFAIDCVKMSQGTLSVPYSADPSAHPTANPSPGLPENFQNHDGFVGKELEKPTVDSSRMLPKEAAAELPVADSPMKTTDESTMNAALTLVENSIHDEVPVTIGCLNMGAGNPQVTLDQYCEKNAQTTIEVIDATAKTSTVSPAEKSTAPPTETSNVTPATASPGLPEVSQEQETSALQQSVASPTVASNSEKTLFPEDVAFDALKVSLPPIETPTASAVTTTGPTTLTKPSVPSASKSILVSSDSSARPKVRKSVALMCLPDAEQLTKQPSRLLTSTLSQNSTTNAQKTSSSSVPSIEKSTSSLRETGRNKEGTEKEQAQPKPQKHTALMNLPDSARQDKNANSSCPSTSNPTSSQSSTTNARSDESSSVSSLSSALSTQEIGMNQEESGTNQVRKTAAGTARQNVSQPSCPPTDAPAVDSTPPQSSNSNAQSGRRSSVPPIGEPTSPSQVECTLDQIDEIEDTEINKYDKDNEVTIRTRNKNGIRITKKLKRFVTDQNGKVVRDPKTGKPTLRESYLEAIGYEFECGKGTNFICRAKDILINNVLDVPLNWIGCDYCLTETAGWFHCVCILKRNFNLSNLAEYKCFQCKAEKCTKKSAYKPENDDGDEEEEVEEEVVDEVVKNKNGKRPARDGKTSGAQQAKKSKRTNETETDEDPDKVWLQLKTRKDNAEFEAFLNEIGDTRSNVVVDTKEDWVLIDIYDYAEFIVLGMEEERRKTKSEQ